MTTQLSDIVEGLRTEMDALHESREAALADGRRIIQASSKTIKHIHRRQFDEAKGLLESLRQVVDESQAKLAAHPSIKYAPYVQDAVKEYVEAVTLFAIVMRAALPTPQALGVQPQAFLNGLCEAASELRRYALDSLRLGDATGARELCDAMEDIYDELITFDFPDSLTSNLRRNVDSLRAVLERTQSDLSVTGMQLELIQELRRVRND